MCCRVRVNLRTESKSEALTQEDPFDERDVNTESSTYDWCFETIPSIFKGCSFFEKGGEVDLRASGAGGFWSTEGGHIAAIGSMWSPADAGDESKK